jgi:hypothetical protein
MVGRLEVRVIAPLHPERTRGTFSADIEARSRRSLAFAYLAACCTFECRFPYRK